MIAYVTGYDENMEPVLAWKQDGEWRALLRHFQSIGEALKCANRLAVAEMRYPALSAIPTPYRVLRDIRQ